MSICLKDKAFRNRARRFGVTEEELRSLYGGGCEICGEHGPIDGKKGLAMDHCESTGDLRGYLCHPCNNQVMKKVDSDPGWFLRAFVYKDTSRFEELSGVFDGNSYREKNAYALFQKYGINKAEHRKLYDLQGGKCALCDVKKPMRARRSRDCLHIDHCHIGEHIRGLLCMTCNRNLMPVIDKDRHRYRVLKAFEYKAKKHFKRTVWRQTKLTKLALAKKERQFITVPKSLVIELLMEPDWMLDEKKVVRPALVEICGHDPNRYATDIIWRTWRRLRRLNPTD